MSSTRTRRKQDRPINLVQLHGIIQRVSREGLVVALKGAREGETWTMPPSLTALHAADPGEYRLKSSGEVVVDPDFTAVWTIKPPQKH